MKKYTPFLFILLPIFLQAQTPSLEDQEAIKRLVRDTFDEIWSSLDTTKIAKFHTDDFLLLEHGEVWDNATVKNYMINALKAEEPAKRENKFEFLRFVQSGKKTIWVAYQNYATGTLDGKVVWTGHWLESAVAIKTKNGWKMQMLHSTRVPLDE